MGAKFNIVIPSIQLSTELKYTLKKLEKINYKSFIVTIVLNKKNFKRIPKFSFPLKILITNKMNMSAKRNLAVRKFNSKYIAFLDSDAYPNNKWLINAEKILKKKIADIIGGPSVPFPNQSYFEMICHYSKRSFFLTGSLNFRKYLSFDTYCDWLESCNFLMLRKDYLRYKGMDENIFLGEDKKFFEKCYNKNNNIKIFFSKNLYIFHKERNFYKFILQRFSFGLDIINILNFRGKLYSFQPILPLFVLISFIVFSYIEITHCNTINKSLSIFFFVQALVMLNLICYLKRIDKIIFTLISINIANVSYAFGNLLKFIGFARFCTKKAYRQSRSNK